MDESEENMSAEDVRSLDSPLSVKNKPKKRSLVERELETNLTARVTSPATGEGTSTSRYGRARRLKAQNELDSEKVMKPLKIDTKTQPQAYKMHASNSPIRKESPKRAVSVASSVENQIENIYNENMSLSRFGSADEAKSQSPAKKFTKVYIRKDLIQKPDNDTVVLIKNLFSPTNKSSHINNILERSSEKYNLNGHGKPMNGFPDTSSVVKTLDFDGKKKKKEVKEKAVAKNELFDLEAGCSYQVGDLAWARVGTYPFWPCIITREPFTDMFVKKKLFGRVEHDVIHVTFFGDNGRRGWIVDNMLRKFQGRQEFEGARAKFTPEAKKKDPRFYAAHFVSEKKLPPWNVSVDEAETLMREPKRLRIDILHDMLEKARATKTTPKRERSGKITRTDSDVSLSESLYDTLFSEDDAKADDSNRAKKSRNKSLDVSEVVTACLDNMAAKTGFIKIQKQSHMDRWLQKAKSKTPEKTQPKILGKTEREKRKDKTKKKQKETRKPRKSDSISSERNLLPYQNEHDYSSVNYENHDINDSSNINTDFEENGYDDTIGCNNIEIVKVESLASNIEDCGQDDIITTIVNDDIVINDVDNVNKIDNCEVVNDISEPTNESVSDSNLTNEEKRVSLCETEQIESESLQSDVLLNIGLQPRRSKRKRQSDVEKNCNISEKNENEETKLESVQKIARTDIEFTVSDRNIINSNTDHRENVLDRDKKYAKKQNIDKAIKEDEPLVSEVGRESKKSKENYHSAMLPLNGPKPVVVIEPLKMETLEFRIIAKVAKQKEDAEMCKLNASDVTNSEATVEKPKVDDILKCSDSSVPKNVDSNVSETIAESSSEADESVSKTVVQDENCISKEIVREITQDEVLPVSNKEVLDDDAVNDNEPEKMETNETSFHHADEKDQSENVESERTCSVNLDSSLCLRSIDANDVVEAPKTDVAMFSLSQEENDKEKLNVVIAEEMYVFDRTLSQDYDEIDPIICEEKNILETDQNNDSVANNDSHCEISNVLKTERTLSPVNDDVDMAKDETTIEKSNEKPKNNIVKDDQIDPAPKIATENVTKAIESESQVFYKPSMHKSKEKIEKLLNNTPCQLYSADNIPMINGDDKTVSDEIHENTNKNTGMPETLEISNYEQSNENKVKKKSPKLSLKRVKDEQCNEKINDIKSDVESPKSIFLDNNSNQDNVSNRDLKDKNEPYTEASIGLDFEMLIDMEKSKTDTPKINGFIGSEEINSVKKLTEEFDADTASMKSEDSGVSITKRKIRSKEKQDVKRGMDDPEFLKYLEIRQDALIDEQPELSQDDIVTYLYQTWLYEESNKSETKKTDDVEQSNLVKGLKQDPPPPKKYKKKPKVEKIINADIRDLMPKDKPKRKATNAKPYYNEEFSDLEEEDLETFSIFDKDVIVQNEDGEEIDEIELYFEKLTKPKPNVFKGYVREKVCEICEKTGNLVKCKNCHGTFHVDCVKKEEQIVEVQVPTRGRKKKKKPRGRKPKGYDESLLDSESQSDEKSQDANLSEEFNMSIEEEESHITVDAADFEAQLEIKMKELQTEQLDDFESDQEIIWDAPPGQCEIVDVKHKEIPIDYSDYKCHNCEKYDTPICFVCKSNKSPKTLTEARQKCQVAHCHRYYHLECLEYWPQTQFNSWEPSKTNKKVIEYIEALSCPRHVCHTCVSDDPRGCKTRFCGDKLARCVKCPATYHSFTKCLPAGTQILTGSQIICPRHYEQRSGKVPCHVNTGWCFICALGGTLICCEYCPTSFHAECLNIKPPEGSYMCEDCETGRLPLYGEMVWVKLGHYRWWPGIVLHPEEIPENILAVKHSPGEFVVRFFGQYDHYWVNRGRVFPFQEGDSGKISSQKSKIDAAFTTAMEHAQRACEILKNVEPNEEEDMDIASSLLPPHYVKLKVNKPVGSLTARRDIDANSLTQCDCDPKQADPCGPYSHCLNRMLLTECGPLCRAGERCNNRAFERRDYPRLVAYRTPQRGWGLKALEDIKQGQFVIEYVGELIDEEEFRRRMRRKHEIRDENFYFLTLDKERMIDAGPKGNLARFMNHCCEPNCETQKWTVLGDVRVGLFALQDIPANSEVTFNYNLECTGIEKKRCMCGAKRCSGYIGAKPKQEEAQPKKLKGPGKRTYKKRKHVEDSPSTSKTKPPIKIKIKPIKPRELTEIEKDLLIIKNATNGMSSDSDSRLSVDERKDTKALKRKRVDFSTDEVISAKKVRRDDSEVD